MKARIPKRQLEAILGAMLSLCLASLLLLSDFTGRCVGVTDGDTVRVVEADNTLHKVRLVGIDAPESKQPWGQRSKQSLSSLVYGQQVTVQTSKKDRYGRDLGKILVEGQDANLSQIVTGMAWWYRAYAREQSPQDRKAYEAAENEAKAAKRGLWSDPAPVAPWDWRKAAKRR